MDDLLEDFIAETRDMLAAVAGEVAAWRANPADRGRIDALFRFVHTVKGNCGFLDQPRLTRLSEAAEDALAALRAGTRAADASLLAAMPAVIGRIDRLVDAIDTGVAPPEAGDLALIAALASGAATPPSCGECGPGAPARTVRVPVSLLERMEAGIAEVACAQRMLAARLHAEGTAPATTDALDRLAAGVDGVRDVIDRARRQPLSILFSRLSRMARALSARVDRGISLETRGGTIELDRDVIAAIRDPLMHVLRNAIDHGIEPPADRRRMGKPPAGRLVASAWRRDGVVRIAIADDGRGIDGDALARRAVAAGILRADQAEALDQAGRLNLVFVPGLSTMETRTALSGRGVGMDVVRSDLARIGGRVEIGSRPGEGACVTFEVPVRATPMAAGIPDPRPPSHACAVKR